MKPSLTRRVVAEFAGTLFLLAAVVGSGIMGERLAAGNTAIALLANSVATGAALVAIILALGSISGAHLNPAVTLADAWQGGIAWRETPAYIAAQVTGAFAGVAAAHLMFGFSLFSASTHVRTGSCTTLERVHRHVWVTLSNLGMRPTSALRRPLRGRSLHSAAYWFTSSTSFANPAVTLARSLSNTFSGIKPADVTGFVAAQLAGAFAATLLFRWLIPSLRAEASAVMVEHDRQ